jgi:multicomponent Na+:H+ antiporter subunit E
MIPSVTIRRLSFTVALVAMWCALWGELSAANIVSGVGLAVLAMVAGFAVPSADGVRFVALSKFLGLVAVDLAASTFAVANEVLTPTDYTDEAIIAVPFEPAARRHLMLLTIAITVTPGTAVVAIDRDIDVMYLHILHEARRADVVEHVDRLVALACQALPKVAS